MAARPRRLRRRLILAFSVGGLVVVTSLGLLTHLLVRDYLVDQRQRSAARQAGANARLVATWLRSPDVPLPNLLGALETPSSSRSVVLHDGNWFATSLAVGRDSVPPALRELVVDEREAGRQRFRHAGDIMLVVGFPLPDDDAYFEVFPLVELERTLRALRYALAVAGVVSVAGCVALGAWGSRRVLRPVSEIGRTASEITAGRLDTRLDAGGDEELVELAASFNAMVESLQRRVERDARFTSDVSHELRTPITALKSAVQVMRSRRESLDERGARALDVLGAEVDRFDRLVRDLLEISRVDNNVTEGDFEEVRLAELVRHALLAGGWDTSRFDADGAEHAVVRADKRRLERVVVNLVENAHAHAGTLDHVAVTADRERARILVDDRGPGVPADQRRLIFERFSRGRDPGRRSRPPGVGLGLALVAEHVRVHGGRVWVEDRDGGGARFVVELPVVAGR